MHLTSEAKPCCVASLGVGHHLHAASNIGKNDVCNTVLTAVLLFRLRSPISKHFWHELQQRVVSGMPNSIQLFKFLIETLVEGFFALFGALEDPSSCNSVGRG
jgi:hypothetical protein